MAVVHVWLLLLLCYVPVDGDGAPDGAPLGPKFKIVANPSFDLSKFAQERHSATGSSAPNLQVFTRLTQKYSFFPQKGLGPI